MKNFPKTAANAVFGASGLLIIALATGSPLIAQEPTLRTTLKGHGSQIWCVAISSDGKLLASGSKDGTAKLWDVTTGKERTTLKVSTGGVRAVAFSRDGKLLATGAYEWKEGEKVFSSLRLWEVATGEKKASFIGHGVGHFVLSVAFSGDGKLLASGSDDWTAKLWDISTGNEKATFKHPGGVTLALSPDGKLLATGCVSNDNIVRLWDVETGKEKTNFKGHKSNVHYLTFSGDGNLLASGDGQGIVKIWDVATGREKAVLKNDGGGVYFLTLSGDGKLLASNVANAVRLWDVATGKEKAIINESGYCMALSTDGKLVVTVGADGAGTKLDDWRNLKLWDVPIAKGIDK